MKKFLKNIWGMLPFIIFFVFWNSILILEEDHAHNNAVAFINIGVIVVSIVGGIFGLIQIYKIYEWDRENEES